MKKILFFLAVCCGAFTAAMSQNAPAPCSEIFISEYVEGANNNKAIEIFNPTNREIDLTQYRLARNNNGGTSLSITGFLPNSKIAPFKTYVVVLDKRDTTKYTVGLEYPIWDGYEVWDTCKVNGVVQINPVTGRPDFCVKRNEANGNLPFRGTVYNDFMNLKCRANSFINPVFDGAMYFNGNDAVMLFKGVPDSLNFTNIVDMVGIYNDPGMAVSNSSWRDWQGRILTLDKNLVRKREVRGGTGLVAYARQDTFRYNDWLVFTCSYAVPSFQNLGSHTCDCETTPPISGRRTCDGNLVTGIEEMPTLSFQIYPNPSQTGNISLEADDIIESVRVIDLMGRVVEDRKIPIPSAAIQLTLSNLRTGLYFVQIRTSDKRLGIQKLIIQGL
jgi:hypothetical protein